MTVTDLDFADDLVLLMEEMEQAQEVLNKLESEAERVGLYCNAKKTVFQTFNHDGPTIIQAKNGERLQEVDNFKYLGGWTHSSSSDINVRKALIWSARRKFEPLASHLVFIATVLQYFYMAQRHRL